MDKIKGNRPTILLIDEHSSLVNVDFSKLEALVVVGAGDYRHYRHPQLDQIPRGTVTGRIRKENPEFQELPGVRELHAKAWGELLHRAFESPEARQHFKEFSFLDRYSSYGPSVFKDDFTMKEYGADHPSRKREPKGPRGKWGKL